MITQGLRRRRAPWIPATLLIGVVLLSVAGEASAQRDRNCDDFNSQASAQRFFLSHGGPSHDPHGLDEDVGQDDGLACEANPGPFLGLISGDYRSGDFVGRLKGVGSCERERRVRIFKRRGGDDRLVGVDHTGQSGRYSVHQANASGVYFAIAARKGQCLRERKRISA